MIGKRSIVPPTNFGQRIVLLGASNLARNIATVVQTACNTWGTPADLLMAAGHGRSYGVASRVLGRTLPGIIECKLWSVLSQQHVERTAAFVTDIGNDILYGADGDTIAAWVECCLERLREVNAHIVMTELPLGSLQQLPDWRFKLFRTLLFPRSRLTLEMVLTQATALNERIRQLAASYQTALVRPDRNWYGFDPIHLRPSQQREAWSEMMSYWNPPQKPIVSSGSVWNAIYLRSLSPDRRRVVGIPLRRSQPCGQLSDGTQISLY